MVKESRVWGEVPPGFKKVVGAGGARLVVRHDREPFIAFSICDDGPAEDKPERLEGRARLRSVNLQDGETALVRSYRHGGLFRRITGGIFFTWPPRPFRELSITEELRRRGIITVEVYGACVEPVWGPLYRGWLITRELKEAQDLWRAFQNGLAHALGVERVLEAVAKGLRALHREGVYHRDLNLKNILICPKTDGVQAYIIDFDKAKLFCGGLPAHLAKRNLARLERSARKLDPAGRHFSRHHWEQLLRYYEQGDGREI